MFYRNILVILSVILASITCLGQDVIKKVDGTTINAIIKEISESDVKYNRYDNPDGPIYVIATSSIQSIKFKNGSVETFNVNSQNVVDNNKTSVKSPQKSSNMREGTIKQQSTNDNSYSSVVLNQNKKRVTDDELLYIYETDEFYNPLLNAEYQFQDNIFYKKAKAYRTTAWIGGGALAGVGIVLGVTLGCYFDDEDDWGSCIYGITIPMVVVGGVWTTCWLVAANKQMKKALNTSNYRATFFEKEIVTFGKSNLTASVNMLGNTLVHDRAYGIGLTFNF